MAHLNNNPQTNPQRLGLLNDTSLSSLGMSSQRHPKEIAPPPVDPFNNSNAGIYIPPEETRQTELSLEEIMGWGLSDDQQDTEEEDDEMDDNEYDLDFEDVDYPPPIKPEDQTPGLCQRHMSHPKFNVLQSMPYVPPHSTVPYPALVTRENTEQALGLDGNNSPPVRFINPSSLQLPYRWTLNGFMNLDSNNVPASDSQNDSIENMDNAADGYDTMNPVYNSVSDSSAPSSASGSMTSPNDTKTTAYSASTPSSSSSPIMKYAPADDIPNDMQTQQDISDDIAQPDLNLGLTDMDIDMEMNDLYPLTPGSNDDGLSDKPTTEHHYDTVDSSAKSPEPVTARTPEEKNSPELKVKPTRASADVPSSGVFERQSQPRRKTTRRRTAAVGRPSPSASHSAAHVCNMTYPDGSECHRSFTRPYDLARHQETLHAAVRKTYTCEVCGVHSKTFSRLDALSRHMRLKHP